MRHLGSLSGIGEVKSGGKSLGHISYDIEFWREVESSWKVGKGRATCDGDVLAKAFAAGDVSLDLESGGNIRIMVTRLDGEKLYRDAEIQLMGFK